MMKVQNIVTDVRSRVETAGKQYQGALNAYFNAQRQAVDVVTRNGQTLANTEIGAAKNLFAAARASFDRARQDGVRKIANNPQAYIPNGRAQIVSAYKDTIDLLVRTSNELTDVVSNGYRSVLNTLTGRKKPTSKSDSSATAAKTSTKRGASANSSSAKKTTATKRKTAATRQSSATAKTSAAKRSTAQTASGNDKAATTSSNTKKTTSSSTSAQAGASSRAKTGTAAKKNNTGDATASSAS